MNAALVFSPQYDFHLPGIQWLHPFDGRKFTHAWSMLQERFGTALEKFRIDPGGEVSREDLLAVHVPGYLDSLRSPAVVARAIEIPLARLAPSSLLDRSILQPMRVATQGTIMAVERALQGCVAFNMSGGFHHAFADHGEGFCIYADAAVAILAARRKGLLAPADNIVVIDLDAHRGNGMEDIFQSDPHVHFFDLYNFQIYPGYLDDEESYIIPMPAGINGRSYLERLKTEFPKFLTTVPSPRLAIYNAGTDIVKGDPLGRLAVDEEDVRERDRFVIDSLAGAGLATAILTSGGYTNRSARLIADAADYLLRKWPHDAGGPSPAVSSAPSPRSS